VGDFIGRKDWLKRKTREDNLTCKNPVYTADSHQKLTKDEWACLPHLKPGQDVNLLARDNEDVLERVSPKFHETWIARMSDMPFSMHSICRLGMDDFCPVISGSAGRMIHPTLDRPCTVREVAAMMGWPEGVHPVGYNPMGQIGKGICPEVGKWLAEQVLHYFNGTWGKEDWSSSYCEREGRWNGVDYTHDNIKPPEKVFDLTRYCPAKPESISA